MKRSTIHLLIVSLLLTGSLSAAPTEDIARPHLNDHNFVENLLINSPFVRTSISNSLGYGKALDVTTPIIDLGDGEVIGFKGDLLFALLEFEYQYAIKEWIALRLKVGGLARAGTGVQSLLSEGLTMVTGFEFGWKVRLRETDQSALAMNIDLTNRSMTGVNISKFVEDIIEGQPASMVTKTPMTRVTLGLGYAWAPNNLFGFTLNGDTGYGESYNRQEGDQVFFRLGGAVEADLLARTSVPIGLSLGYIYDTFPENGTTADNGLHAVGLRIAFTGRDDFNISLDLSRELVPGRDGYSDVSVATTSITLRYYF